MLLHVGNFHQKNVATADYIGYNFNINYTFDMWGQSHGPRIFFSFFLKDTTFTKFVQDKFRFSRFPWKKCNKQRTQSTFVLTGIIMFVFYPIIAACFEIINNPLILDMVNTNINTSIEKVTIK